MIKMKIAILIEHHFDEQEFKFLNKKLPELGYDPEYTSHLWGLDSLTFHGIDFVEESEVETEIEEIKADDYAAIILIGGYPADRLRYQNVFTKENNSQAVTFLRKAFAWNIPVGVMDFGIWALTAAPDLLKGRTITTNHESAADAKNAGGILALGDDDETIPVCRDGNLVTCKGSDFQEEFLQTLDRLIKEKTEGAKK